MRKIVLLLTIILLAGIGPWYLAKPALVTLSLLPQIKTPPINYLSQKPQKTTLSLEKKGLRLPLDIYKPSNPRGKTLVVIHAANEKGKDDPRIQNLAEVFTRVGFDTYVPTLPHLNRQSFHPLAIDEITEAISYAKFQESKQPLTVITFSLTVGPALIAATREEIKDDIDLLVLFGGYLDMENVIKFNTTSSRSHDPFGIWLLGRYYAQFLPTEDAGILSEISDRKWKDPNTDITDLSPGLGPKGQAALALLENRNPDRVGGLIKNLPQELKDFLAKLDPKPYLDNLQTEILLLHSHNDIIIPFEESEKMHTLLKEKNKQVRFIPLDIFDHVNPALPKVTVRSIFSSYLPEFFKLYRASFTIVY